MNEYRLMIFVLAVLYALPEKWKGIRFSQSFEDILRNRRGVNLHAAWHQLRREGVLGEFAERFYFDPLYGTSNLSEIISQARSCYLVGMDGTYFAYHLDI